MKHVNDGKSLRCEKDGELFVVAEAARDAATEPGVDAGSRDIESGNSTQVEQGAPDDQQHVDVDAVEPPSEPVAVSPLKTDRRSFLARFPKPPSRDVTKRLGKLARYKDKPEPVWEGQGGANIDEVQRLVAEGGGELTWQETSSLI